jgi:hypothetical protein
LNKKIVFSRFLVNYTYFKFLFLLLIIVYCLTYFFVKNVFFKIKLFLFFISFNKELKNLKSTNIITKMNFFLQSTIYFFFFSIGSGCSNIILNEEFAKKLEEDIFNHWVKNIEFHF